MRNAIWILGMLIISSLFLLSPSAFAQCDMQGRESNPGVPELDLKYETYFGPYPYDAHMEPATLYPTVPDVFNIDHDHIALLEAMIWCEKDTISLPYTDLVRDICKPYYRWNSNMQRILMQFINVYEDDDCTYDDLNFKLKGRKYKWHRPEVISNRFISEDDYKVMYIANLAHQIWVDANDLFPDWDLVHLVNHGNLTANEISSSLEMLLGSVPNSQDTNAGEDEITQELPNGYYYIGRQSALNWDPRGLYNLIIDFVDRREDLEQAFLAKNDLPIYLDDCTSSAKMGEIGVFF